MNSYDEILSNKSSLEFEINTYRRLLESEEAHVNKINQTSSTVQHITNISSTSTTKTSTSTIKQNQIDHTKLVHDTKINQTEMQAKTTYQRSAKGFFIYLKISF